MAGDCAVPTGAVPCTWTIEGQLLTAPGEYVVTVTVDDGSTATSESATVTVTDEDARSYYVGPLFVSTPSANTDEAVIELRATIQDITSAFGDLAYDEWPGDIRNATVTFTDDTGDVLCVAPSVDLVIAGETGVGTAACEWTADIGNADAAEFEVRVLVNGWYVDSSDTEVVIVVAKPLDNFITGGGYLVANDSAGVVRRRG